MSNFRSVGITGVGSYAPPDKITNFDLEKMVDTSDEWIRTRSGIRERRKVADDVATSDIASIGAKMALENAGVSPEEVQLIINGHVSPDKPIPATACYIQDKLGCKNAAAFDLSAGCTSFVYALSVGHSMVAMGLYDKVLVIGCDVLTKLVDWQDRNTCVLFGDGGGAAVLQPVEEGYGILASTLGADGSGASLIEIPAGGTKLPASHETVDNRLHYIKMAGRDVFKFAVNILAKTTRNLAEQLGIGLDEIDLIVPHQANNRILEAAAKRLKLPMDKFYTNLEFYGNTSAGSIPLALGDALRDGRIKKGDTIFLIGFGAGLTWGGIAMKWAYEPNGKEGES